jgi:hypothetical protein
MLKTATSAFQILITQNHLEIKTLFAAQFKFVMSAVFKTPHSCLPCKNSESSEKQEDDSEDS